MTSVTACLEVWILSRKWRDRDRSGDNARFDRGMLDIQKEAKANAYILLLLLGCGLAAADTFLIKSSDGGRNWADIDPGPPVNRQGCAMPN